MTAITQQTSNVPALRPVSAGLDARDLALPRLYIAQAISQATQEGLVKFGSIFAAQDADDPDPVVLAKPGDQDGVTIIPLALKKGLSRSADGRLETWAIDDPLAPQPSKATGVWVSYQYALAIPSFDEDLPVRWVTSRSGTPAARKINTLVYRLPAGEPPYTLAFRLTATKKSNDKGTFYIPQVTQVPITEDDAAVARRLGEALGDSFAAESAATADTGPSI